VVHAFPFFEPTSRPARRAAPDYGEGSESRRRRVAFFIADVRESQQSARKITSNVCKYSNKKGLYKVMRHRCRRLANGLRARRARLARPELPVSTMVDASARLLARARWRDIVAPLRANRAAARWGAPGCPAATINAAIEFRL
jgi:hypothetical protein